MSICEMFAEMDSRVVYQRNCSNVGAARNFNKVVDLAQGRYFAWANYDDVWAPTYLERCLEPLSAGRGIALVYSKTLFIDEHGDELMPAMDNLHLDAKTSWERLRAYYELFRLNDRNAAVNGLASEGLWTPVYGLMELDTLRKTGLIGKYISSDTVLLEEMLMYGQYYEIDECLFYKRDHPDRSMRACESFDKRIEWFTGKDRPLMLFPHWRLLIERFKAVLRAKISVYAKTRCLLEAVRFTILFKPYIYVKEIAMKGKRLYGIAVRHANFRTKQAHQRGP